MAKPLESLIVASSKSLGGCGSLPPDPWLTYWRWVFSIGSIFFTLTAASLPNCLLSDHDWHMSLSHDAPSPRGVHCKSSLHENENCWTSDSGWGCFRGGFWLSSMRSFPEKLGFCWYLKVIFDIMTNILQYAKDLAVVAGEWVSGDKFWAALPYCNEQLVAHVITLDILTSKKQNSCINTWVTWGHQVHFVRQRKAYLDMI